MLPLNPKLQAIRAELARRNLEDFIRFTYPNYDFGWFNEELAATLTQFVQDVVDGKQPRLMIFAPPRSGKSEQVSRRLPAWALGKHPDLQFIGASYSADLANRMSRDVQRIIEGDNYAHVFPNVKLPSKGDTQNTRTQDLFEIVGHKGAYRAAGVGGGITGMGADIGVIDDPVKDAKEANSKTYRDSVWEWYTTTFYTRLSPKSGILLCMTRWHEDDLAGRLLEAAKNDDGDQWQVIDYPAIAESDEKHRKQGDALHPERFSLDRLTKIMQAIGSRAWNALYQGRPTAASGGMFKTDQLEIVDVLPATAKKVCRGWDLAATKDGGDYTAGVKIWDGADGYFYVEDVERGQWDTDVVDSTLKLTANLDGKLTAIRLPQDPGAAGKTVAKSHTRLLAGYNVSILPVSGDKVTRASPFSSQVNAGNVRLIRGAWNKEYITELKSFPLGKNDDQVDASADAFNHLFEFNNHNDVPIEAIPTMVNYW